MKPRRTLQQKAELALKEAVRGVVERHRETGRPLPIWEKGRLRYISAAQVLRRK